MKLKNSWPFVTLLLLYATCVHLVSSANPIPSNARGIIVPTHYRQADVQEGISSYPPLSGTKEAYIKGGTVSHHLLAQASIAHYFQNLSQYDYTKVILVGPNHSDLGEHNLITSDISWDTPYGTVDPAPTNISLPVDNLVIAEDHSLEVIMPFIKVYLPRAEVVTVMAKSTTTEDEIDHLVQELTPGVDDKTIVLVSTDFSHYLSQEVALSNDQVTLSLIRTRSYNKIETLTSDYLDSPLSLIIMLKVMDLLGAKSDELFEHTDASTISLSPNSPTTSYLFLNFYAETQ